MAKLKNKRKIDGKIFHLAGVERTKDKMRLRRDGLKNIGFRVRVLPLASGGWAIYWKMK